MKWLILILCLTACSGVPPPDVAELQGHVPTTYGFCGTLQVGPVTAVAPAHCSNLGDCDLMRDLCWFETELAQRAAATRPPRKGESVRVVLPSGDEGLATVLSTSQRWRAAWVDWPCLRGDSGAVAWGSDGAAVCMLTGCSVPTQLSYCEEVDR